MDRVYKAWQAVKSALAIRCATHGFVGSEEVAHPEVFGSRYAVFSRGQTRLRLVWDGKEQWFLLEWTEDADAEEHHVSWRDIAVVRFLPREVTQTEESVLTDLLPPVDKFLAGFLEEPAQPIVDLEGFYRSIRCLAVMLRFDGHTEDADRIGVLMSCAWTTGSELIGELQSALERMKGDYPEQLSRLRLECLHFAEHHRKILGLN